MDVRLAMQADQADRVRSGIYAFVSTLERREAEAPYLSITFMPTDDAWECQLRFADAVEGEAFVALLPSLFPSGAPQHRVET
jgi:hypothetical protein